MKYFKLTIVATLLFATFACSNTVKVAETTADATKETTQVTAEKKSYPRVDGSTANMPMMAQIRSSYLGETLTEAENNTEVTTTDYAWRNLLDGNADLLLVYEPSSETKEIIDKSPVKLKVTPIGVDALVFIVNAQNKVKNLTTEQLRDIYTEKITNWKELGGDDQKIEAYQRVLNSGSQTLFLNLVMKDVTPVDAPKKYRIEGMDGLIETLASYNNSGNAIGYSVFYYAKKMYAVPGLELISIDGVMPSDETIGDGKYPFLNEYYLVIREDTPADSETMKLYNYILSDKGKEDIKKAGYIPVK
ncbi:MAG: substrate-binding domain-containing protein [Lachnospiraceae bacterium]|nr:substrate-binding domain-containing protein [Lachnospiraceae bacterium]